MKSGLLLLPKLNVHKYVLLESIPEARSVPVLGREKAEIVPARTETPRVIQITIHDNLVKRRRKLMTCNYFNQNMDFVQSRFPSGERQVLGRASVYASADSISN